MRFEKDTVCIVTGGLGFIGRNFIKNALSLGWKIINIDKITYASCDPKELEHKNHIHINEDISTIKDLPLCDIIVNFAAESHVDNSISGPMPFIQSNFLGVYNLLEIIRKKVIDNTRYFWLYKPPIFVQISTDEVFGDIDKGFFNENDRFHPSNPYSATKASAEMLIVSWARTFNLPYLITRTTNNYGSKQHPEKLIPMAITKCLNNEKIIVHGSGEYIRNWIHVDDNVAAILKVIQEGELNSVYHIASDEEFSVKQIVEKILKYFDKDYSIANIDMSTNRSGADVRYALNADKIKLLGWRCQKSFDESLINTIKDYEQNSKTN